MATSSAGRSFSFSPIRVFGGHGQEEVLVIATAPVEPGPLRDAVREHAGDDAEIRIVAPASDVSPLQWLASDEDEAREKAAKVASGAAESVEPEAARTGTEVGDTDPVQAIEDALRDFLRTRSSSSPGRTTTRAGSRRTRPRRRASASACPSPDLYRRAG